VGKIHKEDNNNVKMPEIDQSLSNSYNTIFHKNKNITKINNYNIELSILMI